LPTASSSTGAIGFRNDEIEMEILRASLECEFSHSLGRKSKKRAKLCPPIGYGAFVDSLRELRRRKQPSQNDNGRTQVGAGP